MKRLILGLAALILVGQASAATFATLQPPDSRTVGGDSARWNLEALNLGDSNLEVRVSSEVLDGDGSRVAVSHPDSVTLEPSTVTENPTGGGWLLLESGEYANITEIPVEVLNTAGEDGTYRVSVTLSAGPVERESGTQQVVDQREFTLRTVFDSSRQSGGSEQFIPADAGQQSSDTEETVEGSQPAAGTGTTGGLASRARSFVDGVAGGVLPSGSTEGNGTEVVVENSSGTEEESEFAGGENVTASQAEDSGETSPTGGFLSGVTSTTGVLLVTATVSVAYMLKVVMLA